MANDECGVRVEANTLTVFHMTTCGEGITADGVSSDSENDGKGERGGQRKQDKTPRHSAFQEETA